MAIPYAEVLARNVRAARAAKQLRQKTVAERMRSLGYPEWAPQTLDRVERAKRRLTAEELPALAYALEISIGELMDPKREDDQIELRVEGAVVDVMSVLRSVRHFNDGMVWWEEGELRIDFGDLPEQPLATAESIGTQQDPFVHFTREQMIMRNQRLNPPRPGPYPPPPRVRRERETGEDS